MKKILLFFALVFTLEIWSAIPSKDSVNVYFEQGEFTKAENLINKLLMTEQDRIMQADLFFKKDLMRRIRLDFRRSKEDVVKYIKQYYNEVTDEMLLKWEQSGHLEMRKIDGEKKYFSNAAPNLFRLNHEAKKKKIEKEGSQSDTLDLFLAVDIPKIINEVSSKNSRFTANKTIELNYTISVDEDAVPAGEIIKCWMPFPRETIRQKNIHLISASDDKFIIASNDFLQRSIYMENRAIKGQKTEFSFVVQYETASEYNDISLLSNVTNSDIDAAVEFLGERPPHILFTDKIKSLTDEIITESMPSVQKAKAIFEWIDANIPWASALEYSTIPNISDYCLTNRHGDCGIKTLLFMTLARYNGIPAKWQSGWMLHPGSLNLHDWCEIYLPDLGWVPVDQSFGMQNLLTDNQQYFFLGGIDSYHLTVNDDYSRDFSPAKKFPRSETVDFQRGEVEWEKGNLYFDSWDYTMKVKFINTDIKGNN